MSLEELKHLAVGLFANAVIANASEESGWLPYRTMPYEELFNKGIGGARAAAHRMGAYYSAHDMDIVRDVDSVMASYDVDAEAKATLAEALEAHERGLYRSCCRVLLPEIERVLREDWIGIGGIETLKAGAITDKVNQYHLEDFILDEGGLVLFGKIFAHLFEWFQNLDDPRTNTTPNRHGATHGWAVYSTQKHSLNTIICADYVFRMVTAFKEREDRSE